MYILGKIAPKIKTQSRHLLRLPQISIVLSGIGRKHTEVKYRKCAIYCRGDDLSKNTDYGRMIPNSLQRKLTPPETIIPLKCMKSLAFCRKNGL